MTHEDLQQPGSGNPATFGLPADDSDHNIGRSLHTIMELTGLTKEQIRRGFRADPPRTVAEQAQATGVSQDELIAGTVAAVGLRLHEAVAAGKITQQRADERLANLEGNITEIVTTIPFRRDQRCD